MSLMSLQYYSMLPSSDLLHRTLSRYASSDLGTLLLESPCQTQQEILHPTASANHSWFLLQLQGFLKWLVSYLTNTIVFHCDP